MASVLRPFQLVGKAVRAFFVADLRVRRGERGLEVVLDERQQDAAAPARERKQRAALEHKEQGELRVIQASLTGLLDEHASNRTAMRHLAFVEHALDRKGLRALDKMPYEVLQRALSQLEGLVLNWSDVGLAALRSKMAVAVMEREPAPSAVPADAPASELDAAVSLAHPQTLQGEEAQEAEAALRAAYGEVMMPGLDFAPSAEDGPAVEMHGELHSPSAKALARAARRGEETRPAELSSP